MALTIDTQDIDNFPGTVKRVTIDLDSIVPTGFEGDEQMLIKVSTTAYADSSNTAIQDLYVLEFDVGWCKSTGLAGTGGRFVLSPTQCEIGVKMDNTTRSGINDGYYTISLEQDGMFKTGEDVAADMEVKIRTLADNLNTDDAGYILAYKNASVEFIGGKFKIISGTMGRYYTGEYKSSVSVTASGVTNSCVHVLGFDMPVTSEEIAGRAIAETLLASNYVANNSPITIGVGTNVSVGDCLMIKDELHTDYFTALTVDVTKTSIGVATSGTNGYVGIANNYCIATTNSGGSMIQILREQDPDNKPNTYFESVDSLLRFGSKSIINQIDFSS